MALNSIRPISFDDEELRARSVRIKGPTPTPLPLKAPSDSIEKAVHPMVGVINALLREEGLTAKAVRVFEKQTTKTVEEIDELDEAKRKTLAKEASAVQSRNTYSSLRKAADYVCSAGALVAASSCPGVAGTFLLISGGTGLVKNLAKDTGLLDAIIARSTESEELREWVTQKIDTGALLLQLGFGSAGGLGSFFTAPQVTGAFALEKARDTISLSSQALSAGAALGQGHYDAKLAELQSDFKNISTSMDLLNQGIYTDTAQIAHNIATDETKRREAQQLNRTLEVHPD